VWNKTKNKYRTTPQTIRNMETITKETMTTTMATKITTIKIMGWNIPMKVAHSTTIIIIIMMTTIKMQMMIIIRIKITHKAICIMIKTMLINIDNIFLSLLILFISYNINL
jgi:hypothetical protein